ncbi:MAG: aminotransferase class I/II-fold pyridoxal phosphate-dependent enzyme [Pseudomonadota bacterium]
MAPEGGIQPAIAPAPLSRTARGILGESGDDGWGMYMRARELLDEGVKVWNLAIGDHDTRTDPRIVEAAAAALRTGPLGYAPSGGTARLRALLVGRARRHGHDVGPEGVQLTMGGQAALQIACALTLDEGDECVMIAPYYASYPQTIRSTGGVPVVVAARADDGFLPDPAAIAAAIGPRTRAILINTPNNPTGRVYPAELLAEIAGLCRRHDLWLISDEVYDGHVADGLVHVSPSTLPGMAGRTLVVNSLSKSHAMTGWRVGYLAGPDAAVGKGSAFVSSTTYGVPAFIQAAAETALADCADFEAALTARYRARAVAALEALPADAPCRAVPPEGGMYLMLDIRPSGLSGTAFAARFLEEEHVAVMPGESFGAAAAGQLRLALVAPEDDLADIAERLAACLGRAT